MAQRRMFSLDIVASDAFLEMPTSSRELYFHLGMYADDDGFVSPKKIMRMIGATEDDLRILLAKRFLIVFENGVVVIKHWKMNNYIQKDRYKETVYTEQKRLLNTKDNGSYTECIQNVNTGKVSIGKISVELGKRERNFVPPTIKEVEEYIKQEEYNVDAEQFLNFYESKGWLVGKTKMKDWKAAVRTWNKRNGGKAKELTEQDKLEQEARELVAKYGQELAYSRFIKNRPSSELLKVKHIINL